jgi:hypothetical protein
MKWAVKKLEVNYLLNIQQQKIQSFKKRKKKGKKKKKKTLTFD